MTGNNFVLLLFTGDFTFHKLQQIQLDARRETSKSELSLNLKRTAQVKGFAISDNQREGNCESSENVQVLHPSRGKVRIAPL